MNRDELEESIIIQALNGNMAAVDFCQRLFRISQTLDDLIDKDREVTGDDIKLAFWDALIELPANLFYRKHFDYLHPIVVASFLDWEDATDLEKGDDNGKDIAFVLRDAIGQIIIHCAILIGGRKHARSWSVKIRKHIMNESLTDYKEGLEQ